VICFATIMPSGLIFKTYISLMPEPKKTKQRTASKPEPIEQDLETIGSEELKRQKLLEEVRKIRLHNALSSGSMCDKRLVLDMVRPVLLLTIEKFATIADDLSTDLAMSDAGIVHQKLSEWSASQISELLGALDAAG